MRDISMRNSMSERMRNRKVKKRIANSPTLTNAWRTRWRATTRNNFRRRLRRNYYRALTLKKASYPV